MLRSDVPRTLLQCLTFYLEDCSARGESVRTLHGKRLGVQAFVVWCATQRLRKARQIQERHLEAYRRYLGGYRQPGNGKKLDISTIRNRLTMVKVFFRRLRRHKLIPVDPAADFELPRRPRRIPKGILSVGEIEFVLRQTLCHGPLGVRDRAIMETYYATGIRRMELARLKLKDINFDSHIVEINRGKGGNDRRVPIAPRACEWITVYVEKIRPRLAKLASGSTLFLANDGLQFREHQLTRLVSKYVKHAGIDKVGGCNLFRHSAATLMHENGADLLYVKEMLGHADVSTTQVYAHVAMNKLREVYVRTHPAASS